MEMFGNGLPKWLKKRRVCEEFALSAKRLMMLGQKGLVKYRRDGNRYVYLTESLENYFHGEIVTPEILNPYDGDSKMMLLKKEVLRKETKIRVLKEREKRRNDNV